MRADVRQALRIYYECMQNCNWYSGAFAIAMLLNEIRKENDIGATLKFYSETFCYHNNDFQSNLSKQRHRTTHRISGSKIKLFFLDAASNFNLPVAFYLYYTPLSIYL